MQKSKSKLGQNCLAYGPGLGLAYTVHCRLSQTHDIYGSG